MRIGTITIPHLVAERINEYSCGHICRAFNLDRMLHKSAEPSLLIMNYSILLYNCTDDYESLVQQPR